MKICIRRRNGQHGDIHVVMMGLNLIQLNWQILFEC